MRIPRNSVIAGVTASRVKKTIQSIGEQRAASTPELGSRLGLTEPKLSRTLLDLARQRFLVYSVHSQGQDWWTVGQGGLRLASARIGNPITRAQADRLLEGAVGAARAINADDRHAYLVERLAVFGSYLQRDADELGDLDVAVSITPKPNPPGRSLMREAKDRFSARSWSERVYAPYREVLQSFRAVGQSLSLHALEEIAALGCTYEGVYAYDGEAGRELDPAAVAWPDEQKALAIEPDPIIIPMSPACIAPRPAPPAPTDPDAGRPLRPPDRKGAPASQLDLTVQHQWVQGYPVSEIRQFHASGLDAWTDDRLRACIANLYDAQ